jgi:rhodanese-related sulfurtransferase
MVAKTFMDMVKEAREEVGTVTPQEAQQLMESDSNALVIDVREPDDIAGTGAIPGSLNVPLGMLAIRADQQLPESMRNEQLQDRSRPILTTCGAGGQASLAAKTLKDMGFENVKIIEGGTKGWKDAGLSTE